MAVTRKLNVPDHVRNIILDQMEWDEVEGKTVGRIKVQLERKDYQDVNKVLAKLGGKWNRAKKFAGHVFDEDPRPKLGEIEDSNNLTLDVWGFFRTPRPLAREMISVTCPEPPDRILEPSAGDGAIADEVLAHTRDQGRIYCIELNPGRRAILQEKGYGVIGDDFMEFCCERGLYNVILMNPPFESGQDRKHILHAYHDCLVPGGRMAAIASAGANFRSDYADLRELVEEHGQMWDLPPNTFEGTGVNAVFIYLQKPSGKFEQGRLL